jgi:hypothetical protein
MSAISICSRWKIPCAALILCGCVTFAVAQSTGSAPKPGLPIPVAALVPTAPIVFYGDGHRLLCYEIYLTNMSKQTWVLRSIQAIGDDGPALLKLDGRDLQSALSHPGRPDLKGDALYELAPGERIIAFIWIKLTGSVPVQLRHELTFKDNGANQAVELTGATTKVSDGITTISPPLRGENWLAADAPSNTSDHLCLPKTRSR